MRIWKLNNDWKTKQKMGKRKRATWGEGGRKETLLKLYEFVKGK